MTTVFVVSASVFMVPVMVTADSGDYGSYSGYSDYGSYDGYSDYGSYAGYSDYGSYNGYSDYGSYSGYSDYSSPVYYPDTTYVYDTYSYPNTGYNYGYSSGYYPQSYGSNYGGYSMPYYGSSGCTSNCNQGCTSNCNPVVTTNTQPLTGTCSTSGTYNKNQTVVWRANASGGTGNYTYSWSGDVSGSGSSISKSYSSTGTKNATVTITSGGQSITRDCNVNIQNNNNDNLEAICRVSDTRINEGERVTYSVDINGGESPFEIDWSGDVNGDDDSVTKRYNDSGNYYVSVRVQDDNGNTVYDDCPTVVVDNDNNDNNDDSNITLVSNGTNYIPPNNGTLASGVFLSDIPYTGVGENLKMILFVLGMTLWSAFMAWVFLKKKAQKAGMTQREMIEKFKRDNLAKRQISA